MTALHHSDTPDGLDTRTLVRRAADDLTARGERVTVRAVRSIVGRGSGTTIAEELRDWRSSDLARRSSHPGREQLLDTSLPPGLAHEAQVLYLRVLAQVGVHLSSQRGVEALASAEAAAQQLATLEQMGRLADFGSGVTAQLVASVEERARLAALVVERDATVAQLATRVTDLTARLGQLTQELANAKLAAAEREALALTRVDGLNKHLMRMTEEQRAQLAAPMAALKERYDGLQTRESILVQQVSSLREQVATLQGRLEERSAREKE